MSATEWHGYPVDEVGLLTDVRANDDAHRLDPLFSIMCVCVCVHKCVCTYQHRCTSSLACVLKSEDNLRCQSAIAWLETSCPVARGCEHQAG